MAEWTFSAIGRCALLTGGLVFVAMSVIDVFDLSPTGWCRTVLAAIVGALSALVAALVIKQR